MAEYACQVQIALAHLLLRAPGQSVHSPGPAVPLKTRDRDPVLFPVHELDERVLPRKVHGHGRDHDRDDVPGYHGGHQRPGEGQYDGAEGFYYG